MSLIVMKKEPAISLEEGQESDIKEIPEDKAVRELRLVTDEVAIKIYTAVAGNLVRDNYKVLLNLSPRALELFTMVGKEVPNFTSVVSALILSEMDMEMFKNFWYHFCVNLYKKGIQSATTKIV